MNARGVPQRDIGTTSTEETVSGNKDESYGASLTLNQRMAYASGDSDALPAAASSAHGSVETWGPSVLKFTVEVPETGAMGVLYIDPGGGYGARQLDFGYRDIPLLSSSSKRMHERSYG